MTCRNESCTITGESAATGYYRKVNRELSSEKITVLKVRFLSGYAHPPVFILYGDQATIGSSEQCDIWLKDPNVPARAAVIGLGAPDRFIIWSLGGPDPLHVDGKRT